MPAPPRCPWRPLPATHPAGGGRSPPPGGDSQVGPHVGTAGSLLPPPNLWVLGPSPMHRWGRGGMGRGCLWAGGGVSAPVPAPVPPPGPAVAPRCPSVSGTTSSPGDLVTCNPPTPPPEPCMHPWVKEWGGARRSGGPGSVGQGRLRASDRAGGKEIRARRTRPRVSQHGAGGHSAAAMPRSSLHPLPPPQPPRPHGHPCLGSAAC